MTLNSTVNAAFYDGDGASETFTISWRYASASDVRAEVETLATGARAAVAFTASEPGDAGGTLTLTGGPLAAGLRLHVWTEVPALQPTSYENRPQFPYAVHEAALDRLAMAIRDGVALFGRAVRAPFARDGVSLLLPPPSPGAALGWNADGDGLNNIGVETIGGTLGLGTLAVQNEGGDADEFRDNAANEAQFAPRMVQRAGATVARPLAEQIADLPKPEDMGASGNGVDDDTAAFDAALAQWSVVSLTPGKTYRVANVRMNPGNTLHLPHSSVLMAHGSLANNEPMLKFSAQVQNAHGAIRGNGLIDGGGIGITGPTRTRGTPLIRISNADRFEIQDVRIENTGYIGLTFSDVQGILCENVQFRRIGFAGQDDNAGSAIWCGSTNLGSFSYDAKITGCHFTDLEWSAIDMVGAFAYSIENNTINGCYEAGIFLSERDDIPGTNSRDGTISGNTIQNVRMKEVSAQGIESNIRNGTISGNIIRFCDKGGITSLDSRHASIIGNQIGDVNQGDFDRGAIEFFSGLDRGRCEHIVVALNVVADRAATPTTAYAVAFYGIGLGANALDARHIRIIENNFAMPFTISEFHTPLAAFDPLTCVIRDNHGAPDLTPRRLMRVNAADLPSQRGYKGDLLMIDDEDRPAVHDGTGWRRLALEP